MTGSSIRIYGERTLDHVTYHSDAWDKAKAAIAKIDDQTRLAEIAKYDEDDVMRIEAIRKLTDQTLLFEIVKNKNEWNADLVGAAISRINDKTFLFELLKEDNVVREMVEYRLKELLKEEDTPQSTIIYETPQPNLKIPSEQSQKTLFHKFFFGLLLSLFLPSSVVWLFG